MDIVWALLWRDLWTPIWPNLAASAITTLPLLAWHHRRIRAHISGAIAEATARPKGDQT